MALGVCRTRFVEAVFISTVAAVLLSGCAHTTVQIPVERLPEVVAVAAGAAIEVHDGEESFQVDSSYSPELLVDVNRGCSDLEKSFQIRDCLPVVTMPIGSVALEGEELHFEVPADSLLFGDRRQLKLATSEIQSLSPRFDPPDRRPTFGLGLVALGPSHFGGWQAQWIPAR
ncbi:hypothetical protein [Vulgatibacter incomptus]|uniref:Lipoprotein n=1 Tax=Vulgatibacter incomptus TaxID=1391653 RepID=A0A0K1PA85_9BACT|nr:hypothetical protein [Vulgatibacter incomptus]AKU90029.1 hypothetical protein AKJ08_0416 [Vulgatibacter incomptus]